MPESLTITRVEISPGAVTATPGTSFALTLRASGMDGGVEIVYPPVPGATPTWMVSPNEAGTLTDLGAWYRVRLTLTDPPPANSAVVYATVQGHTAEMELRVLSAVPSPPTDDYVVDERITGTDAAPTVAVAEGATAGVECPHFNVAAFVGLTPFGNQVDACSSGRAYVFATQYPLVVDAGAWSPPAGDLVDLPQEVQPDVLDVLDVALYLAVTPGGGFDEAKQTVTTALANASDILKANRVGLGFRTVTTQDVRGSLGDNWVGLVHSTSSGDACDFTGVTNLNQPNTINVLVGDAVLYDAASYSGWACGFDPTHPERGFVIFLSYWALQGTTLAHELGHALEGPGHAKVSDGFSSDNLMGTVSNSSAAPRGYLTVGQAFGMQLDSRLWRNHVTPLNASRDCSAGKCLSWKCDVASANSPCGN